jgi:putative ABC transport system ATP-binding protein
MDLDVGRCVAISGPSGSGKSLFLRMIADLDPNDGDLSLDGVGRAEFEPPEWRRRVTYVAAESSWWLERAVEHFADSQIEKARLLAERIGVDRRLMDGPVARLSTGERLRLALVRAFVLEPPVLLLDEPTGPLDPKATEAVESYLNETMASGTAIVLVTHEQGQVARLGARHYRMVDRRLEQAA